MDKDMASTKNVVLKNKDNEPIYDNQGIANKFNYYYTNITNNLGKNIEKSELTSDYF